MNYTFDISQTQAQRQAFDDNGFMVVRNVLTPAELTELRAMIDGAMDGSLQPAKVHADEDPKEFSIQWEPRVKDLPGVPRRDKIRIIFHMAHTHPYFWKLATSKKMLDLCENLIGPNIKYYTDQMFCKPAKHGSEVPWHQDSGYWPAAEPRLLSCWLAIDDVTLQNGCVRFVPGTHKAQIPHVEVITDNPNNLAARPDLCDASKEVPVEMTAGSIGFHHSLALHRSFPNLSDKPRRGLVMIYLPADLKFNSPWVPTHGFRQVRP
jgi:phytanoyl-CoA hydroxylase